MRCLSVHRPWAWAIVSGLKCVENRSRRTRHRGPLLVHAGKARWPVDVFPDGSPIPPEALAVAGAIVGVVEVVDCLPVAELADPWASGPWCWVLANARAFARPIPYRGRQNLFPVPDELVAGVRPARRPR